MNFYSVIIHDDHNDILVNVFEGLKIITSFLNDDILKLLFENGIIYRVITMDYVNFANLGDDSLKIIANFFCIYQDDKDLSKNNLYSMVNLFFIMKIIKL